MVSVTMSKKKAPPRKGSSLEHIHESLRDLAIPVADLTPDPQNARRHSEQNLDAIEASLKQYKFREPIVVQKQGMIVRAGNGRLEVAKRLGWRHIPAIVVDEDDVAAQAFAIADNRTAELAEWDEANLAAVLSDLRSADDLLATSTGFTSAEIDALISAAPSGNGDLGGGIAKTTPEPGVTKEIDVDGFSLGHKCPRCGMEFDD
jgi:ParB/RepB/Spo0J family partition protein